MNRKKKIDFLTLMRDEEFVRRVRICENPSELLNELMEERPEDRETIRYAFEFIRLCLLEKRKMYSKDYDNIFEKISEHSEHKRNVSKRRVLVPYLWKAAIIFIIFAIGSLLIYYQNQKDPLEELANRAVTGGDKSVIVLSDGTERVLENNDSYIDYNSDEKGIIITSKGRDEEKIENKLDNHKSSLNQVVVPYGQQQTIFLSDETVVRLNSGSRLIFPAFFSGKTREVYLVGEAYFEVHRNDAVPFLVKTDHIDIRVLGTKFNVSAYNDESMASTVLVEGKVNVSQKNRMFANSEFTLTPGEGCFYSKADESSEVKKVNVDNFILWKDGLFLFEDMKLIDVVRYIKRYYNIPIQVEGDRLANTLISGKLVLSEDLNEVMEYLSKTIEGQYIETEDGRYKLVN